MLLECDERGATCPKINSYVKLTMLKMGSNLESNPLITAPFCTIPSIP